MYPFKGLNRDMKEYIIGRRHGSVMCSLLSPSPLARSIWKYKLSSLNKMLSFSASSFLAHSSHIGPGCILLFSQEIQESDTGSTQSSRLSFGNTGSWSLTLQRPSFEFMRPAEVVIAVKDDQLTSGC